MELHDCPRYAFPAPVNHNVIVRRGLIMETKVVEGRTASVTQRSRLHGAQLSRNI